MYQVDPTGQWMLVNNAWVPNTQGAPAPPPPPPPPAAPPAPPAYGAPPFPPPPPPAPTWGAPPQQQVAPPAPAWGMPPTPPPAAPGSYGPPGASMGGDGLDFGAVAWTSGIPIGKGYVIRVEDIEAGLSGNNNAKLTWTGVTQQPNGNVPAGFKAVWSYTMTEKSIGRLGRDMINAQIPPGPLPGGKYPTDPAQLAVALLNVFRGVVLVVDSVESQSSDLPNVSIVARYNAQQGTAPAASNGAPAAQTAVAQQAPPPPPPPAPPQGPPQVSFPAGPPQAGQQAAFHSV